MADGSKIPEIRVGVPLVEDVAYLARNMRPDEIEQFVAGGWMDAYEPDAAARVFATLPGPSYVLVGRDGMPVFMGGFIPVRKGVWEAWAMGTMDGWAKYWRAITKVCRQQIEHMLTSNHRVQICALASRTQAHEWYERGLKMTREGQHKGYYADGQDAVMFARCK